MRVFPWLQATPHRECRVRVTVLPDSSSPDGGRKVKLAGVIVVEGLFQAYGASAQGHPVRLSAQVLLTLATSRF